MLWEQRCNRSNTTQHRPPCRWQYQVSVPAYKAQDLCKANIAVAYIPLTDHLLQLCIILIVSHLWKTIAALLKYLLASWSYFAGPSLVWFPKERGHTGFCNPVTANTGNVSLKLCLNDSVAKYSITLRTNQTVLWVCVCDMKHWCGSLKGVWNRLADFGHGEYGWGLSQPHTMAAASERAREGEGGVS